MDKFGEGDGFLDVNFFLIHCISNQRLWRFRNKRPPKFRLVETGEFGVIDAQSA